MTELVQISIIAIVALALSAQFAKADASADQAEKVPTSLPPHPDHEKYLGWDGVKRLMRDQQQARQVNRQAKQRFRAAQDIPPIKDWQPISFAPSPTIGQVNWTPALLLKVRHLRADEVNIAQHSLLRNRHINPKSYFKTRPPITRNSKGRDEAIDGAAVSFESMPGGHNFAQGDDRTTHQRDWDFLVRTRNRIWAQCGIKDSDPTLKKLKILAEYVRDRQFLDHWPYSVHPVDYLHHATYCTGRANTMMALATTMGLRVRSINHAHHSMCEVQVDGKWYFIENASGRPFTLAEADFMEMTANPDKVRTYQDGKVWRGYAWKDISGEDLVTDGPMYLLAADWWHFNWTGGGLAIPTTFQVLENGCGLSVCLDGQTAHALYPKAETYYLKQSPITGMYTIAGKYGWWHSHIALRDGQALRRRVYVGKIKDAENPVTYAELVVLCKAGATEAWPEYGGDLYLRVNDHVRRFEWSHLQWRAESVKVPISYEVGYMMNPAGVKYVEYDQIRIPFGPGMLKENAYNTFEFGLSGPRGDRLEVMIFPDPVLPYGSAYGPGRHDPQAKFTIVPDHICEVVEPGKAAFHTPEPHVVSVQWPAAAGSRQGGRP